MGKNIKKLWSTKEIFRNLPFLIFVAIILCFYIANVHFCEKKVRAINERKKEIQELKYQYRSLNADLMYNKKQSEVAEGVAALGLISDPASPPKSIQIDD